MQIAKVLAVYRVSPLLLVMEAEDGTVVELSLKAIEDGGHRLRECGWPEAPATTGHQRETERARLQDLTASGILARDALFPFIRSLPYRLKLWICQYDWVHARSRHPHFQADPTHEHM